MLSPWSEVSRVLFRLLPGEKGWTVASRGTALQCCVGSCVAGSGCLFRMKVGSRCSSSLWMSKALLHSAPAGMPVCRFGYMMMWAHSCLCAHRQTCEYTHTHTEPGKSSSLKALLWTSNFSPSLRFWMCCAFSSSIPVFLRLPYLSRGLKRSYVP